MLRYFIDAVRAFLISNTPELAAIYLDEVPDGFERPSFLIKYKTKLIELTSVTYKLDVCFSITYFSNENEGKVTDSFHLLNIQDIFIAQLTDNKNILEIYNQKFRLQNLEFTKKNNELIMDFNLNATYKRTQEIYELIKEIKMKLKTKKEE